MRTFARLLLWIALAGMAAGAARAERIYNQAELDALLAPIALYPDSVLGHILAAAEYPEEVQDAAAWSRANPGLRGNDAVRAVEPYPWHPSVKELVAFPDLLDRMDESPQWLADLAAAHRVHGHYVMDTVNALRARAQANGYAPPPPAPVYPHVVAVHYYDPYVVYGPWWWPAYRPIFWRPWHSHHVVVVHRPAVRIVHRPVVVKHHHHVDRPRVVHHHHATAPTAKFAHSPEPRRHNGPPSPAAREQKRYERERREARPRVEQHRRVPEERRQPIVQQHRPQPQAHGQGLFRAESRNQGQGRSHSQGRGHSRGGDRR